EGRRGKCCFLLPSIRMLKIRGQSRLDDQALHITAAALQQSIDLRATRHGARCAQTRDRYSRNGTAEAGGLDNVHAFCQCERESAIESIAGAGGLEHWAGIECSNVLGEVGVLH